MKEVLQDFVGLSASDYEIERCHRTPTFIPPQSESQAHRSPSSQHVQPDKSTKPRMIHVCFSSFAAREKVRQECIQKFKAAQFKGKKLFVSEDFSKRVVNLRKEKSEAFKRLKTEGKKPFFLYPAKLAYRAQSTGKLHILG